MRRTTIKDVAALAGVSPATVSRTLDDRPEISAETKERVRAACASWDTCPTPPPRADGAGHPHSGGSGAGRVQPLLHGHRHCH